MMHEENKIVYIGEGDKGKTEVEKYRRDLILALLNYDDSLEKMSLNLSRKDMDTILFDRHIDGYKYIAILFDLFKKIDLTGVSFCGVDVSGRDFSHTQGVVLYPQLVYQKDLSFCTLNGVTIQGSLNFTSLCGTDFRSCRGDLRLNPQTLQDKDLRAAILRGVRFCGTMDGVMIHGTDFSGTYGVEIDPETAKGFEFAKLGNAKLVKSKKRSNVVFFPNENHS